MSKIVPLFSGSKGNSYLLSSGSTNILIDAGRNAKQICDVLKSLDVDEKSLNAILITHEHSDHISALRVLNNKLKTDLYMTPLTADYIVNKSNIDDRYISVIERESKSKYMPFSVGEIDIYPFSTSHDASESVGYMFKFKNGTKLTFATDLGFISDQIKENMLKSDAVVIESNHDINMLKCGPYPYMLKKRISSDKGHLSNDDCASVLPELVKSGTRQILLAHLSEQNNYPSLALETSKSELTCAGLKIGFDYLLNVAPENFTGMKVIF